MKQIEEKNKSEILFNFSTSIKEEQDQIEFLYTYYIAKLKLLRKSRLDWYITKEQADAETFYKDVIAACACYMEALKLKKKKNEGNNQESGDLP